MSQPESLPDATIRRARLQEAALLTSLALRAKASWGYDAGFMAEAMEEIAISPATLARVPFYVIERDGRVLGFYSVSDHGDGTIELTDLFVDPDFPRQGIGRRLLEHAKQCARTTGQQMLLIRSDPHAEPFYLGAGATYLDPASPHTHGGADLPLLRIDLE